MGNNGYVDRPTAFFYEICIQIEKYDPERFRRFYHEHIGEQLEPERTAMQLGADFLRASYFYTVLGCDLDVGFFGDPQDELVSPNGKLTSLAIGSLERVRTFRSLIATLSNTSKIPFLEPGYPLNEVSTTLFVGRRALGPKTHERFRKLAAEYLNIKVTTSEVFEPHSFDTIVDRAMSLALTPFPFPNQALLKEILEGTDNARVIKEALDRLDRTLENGEIFERYLRNSRTVRSAVPGAQSIRQLRAVLPENDESLAALVQTRIAILEKDLPNVEKIAASAIFYDSVHMAIESIEDPVTLKRIRPQIAGDTPRDVVSRSLIDAKLAASIGDGPKLEQVLADLSKARLPELLPHEVLRVKARMQADYNNAPEVFLSYRHESDEHRQWVKNLAQDLRHNGVNALLDEWEINLGDSIADFAASAIFRVQAMLFLITETSVAAVESDEASRSVVKFEFQIANARRYKDGNFRIIGILRSGERPPNHLADSLYLDFRHDQDYDRQLNRLVNNLVGKSERPGIGTGH